MDVYLIDDDFTIEVIEDPSEEGSQNAQTIAKHSKKQKKPCSSFHTKRDFFKSVEKIKIEENKIENTESLNKENDEKVTKKKRRYNCNLCDYYTTTSRLHWIHMRAHLHPERKLFKCKYCDYTTFGRSSLTLHMDQCISKEKRVKCSRSEFAITKHKNLRSHIQNLQLNKKRKYNFQYYRCADCNFLTKNKKEFDDHKANRHRIKIKCNECGFEVFTRAYWINHRISQQNINQNVKKVMNYKCDSCNYEAS